MIMDNFVSPQDYAPLLGLSSDSLGLNGYEPFAIKVGGVVTVNGGADFDGIPTNLGDDARIYASGGFDFNGKNLILPVLRSISGDSLLDANGKLVLI